MFREMTMNEMMHVDGGMGDYDWVVFGAVTIAGGVIGAAAGSILLPGGGTVAGYQLGQYAGVLIGSTLAGAGYIAIDHRRK